MRGLALVAVLWIVAALSILVLGMSRSVRDEVRTTASQRQILTASGWGDAALQLVLQEMSAQNTRPSRRTLGQARYQGKVIDVTVLPTSGLIDINNANAALLTSLFSVAGQRPAGIAADLAQATIAARTPSSGGRARQMPFEATEDLLQVPGIDYALYARIAGLVTVDGQSGGRVDPLAAPMEVLLVLADGNAAHAARIAALRDEGSAGIDTTALNGAHLGTAATDRFRLEARVKLADGRSAVMSRTVDLSDGSPDGLPWRTLQARRWVETPPDSTN